MQNRVIKFRVWNPEIKMFKYTELYGAWMGLIASKFEDEKDWKPNKECAVQQYTGLLDKNNKEIYEGDLIKIHGNNIGEVKFHNGVFGYLDKMYSLNKITGLLDFHAIPHALKYVRANNHEVIGNIFENPGLLDPKNNLELLNGKE